MPRPCAHESLIYLIERCQRSKRRFYIILTMMIIVITYPTVSFLPPWSQEQPLGSMQYRIRPQNASAFHFVKFRDLTRLITLCEGMPTIQCLKYLDQNQSDYLQPLSPDEWKTFKDTYCLETRKMLYHTVWVDARRLDHPTLQLHIHSYLRTQNRQCSRLIVWLLPPFDVQIMEEYNRRYAPNVEFRTLSPYADQLRQVGVYVRLPSQR
jgi:hypothetical protein